MTESKKPRLLYIPWDKPVHDEESWKLLQERFDLVVYDFNTVQDYMDELKKPMHGKIGFIDGICRSTWLKSSPYLSHYILQGEAVKLLPQTVKIIVQSGHGYDIVDVDYLTSRNIVFCNSPNSCSRATADIGTLLVLNVFRYASYAEYCVRSGDYYASQQISQIAEDPQGKVLGIIGLGDIGKLVATSCKSFGMEIIYHNRTRKEKIEKNIGGAMYYPDFKEFLAAADCILVLCPLSESTKHLINFDAFKSMKNKVRLVNIARGPVVEEAAVIDAIDRGQLVGAGFDVHEFEPRISEKLLKNWKITLLPHLGAVSRDSWKNFEKKCTRNLVEFFDGKCPSSIVNSSVLKVKDSKFSS